MSLNKVGRLENVDFKIKWSRVSVVVLGVTGKQRGPCNSAQVFGRDRPVTNSAQPLGLKHVFSLENAKVKESLKTSFQS